LSLSSASFAYPQHQGDARAELAKRLKGRLNLDHGFVLSTCLRIEVVVPGEEANLVTALFRLFGDMPAASQPQIRQGDRAVTHLFRVAAGLESPILGEHEILTQFRQTVIESEEAGLVDGLFARLLETAVAVGRQAREMLPGSPHNSMAAVAAQAIGAADRVAVLGSGLMASAVIEGLLQLPAPPRVTAVARHPEKVAPRDGLEVWPFVRAAEAVSVFPAVVSATSAKRRLVDDVTMSAAVAARENALTLIDMAMPPDFPPPGSAAITYIDIDDLARMADRRPRASEADVFVERAADDAYRLFRDHHEVGPLIGGMMRTGDEIVERTVERFAGRLGAGDDEAVLRQAAHTVARTLLAGPVSYVKQADRAPEAIDVIADAFGVDDE
jgi:glutamyl-tRNA reductase